MGRGELVVDLKGNFGDGAILALTLSSSFHFYLGPKFSYKQESPKPVEKKAILASLRGLDIKTDAGQASEEEETLRVNTCVINSRRNTQRILGILHEGVWISDPNAIKYAFLNFYKENFACHDSLVNFSPLMATNRLSDSDHVYLDAVVSFKEIKHAVWDCGSQKAPGLDGFSFMFIKKYWDLLHLDIQNFVVSFFSS
ncbi:hypothetical protein Tco_1252100, partial [Tanacetum coccineum]